MEIVLDGNAIWLPAVAALGVAVGLIAGMFGVGGGFLLVPMMSVVLGVPWPYAVGAGLCQTIATSLASFLRYRKLGFAEWRFDVLLLGGSLIGVDAGTRLLTMLERTGHVVVLGKTMPTLRLVAFAAYTVLFLAMAYLLWFKPTPSDDLEIRPGPLARVRLPPLVDLPQAGLRAISGPFVGFVGPFNGVLGGLLGIGGGILLIPIMIYGYGFNIRNAAGTGIIMVFAISALGTFQHARLGNVHLGLATTIMIGAALAAQVGANLTRRLSPHVLRRGLAIVLLVTVVALVFKSLR